jgi:beta-glucanase (GH16 family)
MNKQRPIAGNQAYRLMIGLVGGLLLIVGLVGAEQEARAQDPLTVSFVASNINVPEGQSRNIAVRLNRPLTASDPDQVSITYTMDPGRARPDRDYVHHSGTLAFTFGGPTELTFPFETIDNSKYNPRFNNARRVILRLQDPVGMTRGSIRQQTATIVDNDPFDPNLLDDFESAPYLWSSSEDLVQESIEPSVGGPLERPGQDQFEGVLKITPPRRVLVQALGEPCAPGNGVVPVLLRTTSDFDALTVDHTSVRFGSAAESRIDPVTGKQRRHEVGGDLMFHFRRADIAAGCDGDEIPFTGRTHGGEFVAADGAVSSTQRDFALSQDWSSRSGLAFWYYGENTGEEITVSLKDNRAADPGPQGWELAWSDEFDGPAGTPPDPAVWGYEIGDGAMNGISGWGNNEREYYTDAPENAAMDGEGNLVITAREANGSLDCYYGPCEYTSARLLTQNRAEFAYGRIESRLRVPEGLGMWPAFWGLGTDLGDVGWPTSGEIDFMEFVGRRPNEVHGTLHGPGYSGGGGISGSHSFGQGMHEEFHTIAIEWEPDVIRFYVDDIQYHQVTAATVAPRQWAFNKPFFLLLNLAVGGNFPGPVGPDTEFPNEYTIDYVRVYQAPDTAERFGSTFIDDFEGWQRVSIPFASFERAAVQPGGAPDDGLGLTDVWGYGLEFSGGTVASNILVDQVQLCSDC